MNTTKKIFSIGVAFVLLAFVLFVVFTAAAPAISATLHALSTATRTPPPGEVIPLKPISGLTSLNADVNIQVNGLINGERAKGDLNAVLASNDQKKSQVTITGDLLGDIAAQVGGSLVGLFTPSKVDLYKVPEGTFIVIKGLFPVCIKTKTTQSTKELDDLSPQSLLGMLTGSEVARGKYVGDATLNGAPVKHYVINGDAFLAAAKKSRDPKLKAFADGLWSAEDADLYVDAKGGYPVAFSGGYSGAYAPLKFEGDFNVQIQLTGINSNTPVSLPSSCKNPISP
jgi:biopolymer transport protein ExbD